MSVNSTITCWTRLKKKKTHSQNWENRRRKRTSEKLSQLTHSRSKNSHLRWNHIFIRLQVRCHYPYWEPRSCCWYSTDNFSDPQSFLVTQQQSPWRRPPGGRFGLGSTGNRRRSDQGRRMREKGRDAIFYQIWLYKPSSTNPCFDFI